MREYRYQVDAEGRIFHEGSEVLDPLTLRFFLRAMTHTPEGRWLVVCQGERNWFESERTPFVVQRVRPGAFPARFGRLALQQLGTHLRDDAGRPVLVLGGRCHTIPERERTPELT